METLYFVVVGVVLYVVADKLLDMIERRRGARLEQRTIWFFGILLGLALVVFPLIQQISGQGAPVVGG